MFGELNLISQYTSKSSIAVLPLEWCCPIQHLIDQNSQGPPVDSASVPTALDDLGGNVFFCTNKRVCSEVRDAGFGVDGWQRGHRVATSARNHGGGTAWSRLLGKVKVRKHNVAGLVKEDIYGAHELVQGALVNCELSPGILSGFRSR